MSEIDRVCSGYRLKECREKRGLSQKKLAELVNYDYKYISMLETGQRAIDWNKAHKFGEVLSVNPAYIMRQTDNMFKPNEDIIPEDIKFAYNRGFEDGMQAIKNHYRSEV